MVHGHEPSLLFGVLQKRELGNPQKLKVVFLQKVLLPCQLQTEIAQHVPHYLVLVSGKEKEISCFAVHGSCQVMQLLFGHKFGEGRLVRAVLQNSQIGQPFGSKALGKLHQSVNLLAGHAALALGIDSPDTSALVQGVFEHGKLTVSHHGGHVFQLHAKAQVRLVGAKAVHGLLPRHPGDGHGNLYIHQLLKQPLEQTLIDIDHIVHIHKGQLHVDLGKLRLAVRPKILIPVASGQLEVTVIAGAHQQLFEQLGGLGQGVEGARVYPAGHQIVSGSLRRALYKGRSLNLQKAFLCQKFSGENCDIASKHHASLQVRPP